MGGRRRRAGDTLVKLMTPEQFQVELRDRVEAAGWEVAVDAVNGLEIRL